MGLVVLNLKDELNEYIEDTSIDFDKLIKKVSQCAGRKDIDKKGLRLIFLDKILNIKKILIMKSPYLNGNDDLYCESILIKVLKIAYEADEDETPMWVEKMWLRNNIDGKVYRWLGENFENHTHTLKNVITKVIDIQMEGEIFNIEEKKVLLEKKEGEHLSFKHILRKDKWSIVEPILEDETIYFINTEVDI